MKNFHFTIIIFNNFQKLSAQKTLKVRISKNSVMSNITIDTNFGKISFKLLPELAPETVRNFEKLAKEGFYDGTLFHRVIPGFMIQGGDPNTKD